jgi:hypothetical protein
MAFVQNQEFIDWNYCYPPPGSLLLDQRSWTYNPEAHRKSRSLSLHQSNHLVSLSLFSVLLKPVPVKEKEGMGILGFPGRI